MRTRAALLLAIAVASQLLQVGWGLKILSFNIENFSEKKYQKQSVVDVLLKVPHLRKKLRYSIVHVEYISFPTLSSPAGCEGV